VLYYFAGESFSGEQQSLESNIQNSKSHPTGIFHPSGPSRASLRREYSLMLIPVMFMSKRENLSRRSFDSASLDVLDFHVKIAKGTDKQKINVSRNDVSIMTFLVTLR